MFSGKEYASAKNRLLTVLFGRWVCQSHRSQSHFSQR